MNVIKRDGSKEPLNVEKLNKVVMWACEGLDANPSDVLMNSKLKIFDGIKTTKIHEILVNSSVDLISEKTPDYQYVASRLFSFYTRKQIFGVFKDEEMPHIKDVVKRNIEIGLYDPTIIDKYDDETWDKINDIIDHSQDSKLSIASYQKMHSTYLVKNRTTNYVYETPQYAFVMIGAVLFNTLKEIKDFYRELTAKWLNIPTPIMAGVRTGTRQFASCCLIDIDDDLDSIYASNHAIGRFVSRRAGIGVNMGRIRSFGSEIRKGEASHTGIIPFLKLVEAATKSCSQGGIRDGSSSVHFQIWNKEIEEILVLKNNKGTDDNRVRRLDYSIQISKLFWERMLKGEDITLFSTYDVPGLYEAFGTDAFDDMYRKYENNKLIKGKKVKGKDLLITLASERMNTGRIYIQNIDNVNKQTPFKDHLTMSNLCLSGDTMVDVRILSKLEDELLFENLEELEEGLYCGKISLEELDSIYNTFVSELDSDNRIYVLSKDIESDIIEYNLVTNSALMNESSKVIKITSELNGENVTCTESHKIFTKNRGYVLACELKSDDTLDINGGNGGNLLIENLNYEIPVYDITVDKVHNFYANDILVHNCQEINLPTSPLTDINDGLTYKKKIKVRKEDYEKFLELTKGDSIKIKKGLN